jgi:hypothetical protein
VPLPETIAVKYTEEQAEYLTMRPVVPQTFRGTELIDMIVQVVGKDSHRIQQILRAGTIVFRSYRYWWPGFEPDAVALQEILATYPDAEPARPFAAELCTEVILESSGSPPRHSLRIKRDEAEKKSGIRAFFRSGSFWNALLDLTALPVGGTSAATSAGTAAGVAARSGTRIHYKEYSYAVRADLYSRALAPEEVVRLARDANRFAPRELRLELMGLPSVSQIVFVCPR